MASPGPATCPISARFSTLDDRDRPAEQAVLSHFVHQPGAQARLGSAVEGRSQDVDAVMVLLSYETTVRARGGVGYAGARSSSRAAIGSSLADVGFNESLPAVDLPLSASVLDQPLGCLQIRPGPRPTPSSRCREPRPVRVHAPSERRPRLKPEPGIVCGLAATWMDPDVDELERGADHTFDWLVASHRRDRCAFPDGVPTCVIRPDRMELAHPRRLDVVTDAMRVPVPPP